MPLKCLHHGTAIFAFDFDAAAWAQLKEDNRKERFLTMPCCQGLAIPKVSKRGTQFFAHKQADECSIASAPESAEHLSAKTLVCQAAREAGWTADTEVRGQTPNGEEWIADVLATKGNTKVAIEIQWSPQSTDETKRRQRRYAESGVRAIWLLRHPNLLMERETPTFSLAATVDMAKAKIQIPAWNFDWERGAVNIRKIVQAHNWQQSIQLGEFVRGALSGKLKFSPSIGQPLPVYLKIATVCCPHCDDMTTIVQNVTVNQSDRFAWLPDINLDLVKLNYFTEAQYVPLVAEMLPPELLRQHGIGAVKQHSFKVIYGGHLERYKVFMNHCIHCDQPLETDVKFEFRRSIKDVCLYQITMSPTFIRFFKNDVRRWWFNMDSGGSIGNADQ